MDSYRKSYVVAICGFLLFLGVLLFSWFSVSSYSFASMDQKIQDLRTNIEKQSVINDSSENDVRKDVSGMDMVRVRSDNKKAETFFKKLLTWSSLDEYQAVRESIVKEYDLSDNNAFLDVFFPEGMVAVDEDGKVIDSSFSSGEVLNLQFVSMNSHVTDIQDSVYHYFTEVVVSSKAANGGVATGTCVFLYTVSEDGLIRDLQAYVVAD